MKNTLEFLDDIPLHQQNEELNTLIEKEVEQSQLFEELTTLREKCPQMEDKIEDLEDQIEKLKGDLLKSQESIKTYREAVYSESDKLKEQIKDLTATNARLYQENEQLHDKKYQKEPQLKKADASLKILHSFASYLLSHTNDHRLMKMYQDVVDDLPYSNFTDTNE